MNEIDRIVEIGIDALKNASKVHDELEDKGLEPVQMNDHGDCSLVGDIEAEKAVIETFRASGIPLRIVSEEHGQVDLSDDPQFLAVLDGLDGTSVYKEARGKKRYGTMFGVFSSLDPVYDDYIFSGIMELSNKLLYYSVKNEGCHLLRDGDIVQIGCSAVSELVDAAIHVDEFFDADRGSTFIHDTYLAKLDGHDFINENSSAIRYVDLVEGQADLVLECTRKGNLEIAVAFGLVTEAGGVIVTKDGVSIGNKKYLLLGQDKYIPVISASNIELAKKLIDEICP